MKTTPPIPPPWRVRLRQTLIVAALSLLWLAALEAGVRLLAPQHARNEMLAGESLAVKDDALGHRNRPGAVMRQMTPEFTATYVIGADGLRTLPEAAPSGGRFRVLLVGDSFTFGIGNEAETTLGSIVERTLQLEGIPAEVLNAGVPGYDTRTEALYLDELLPRFRPDAVVLVFLPNDLFTNRPLDTTDAPGTVVAHDAKTDGLHLVTWLRRRLLQSDRLYAHVYTRTGRGHVFQTPLPDAALQAFQIAETLLEHAQARCEAAGVPLVIFSIPQHVQVLAQAEGGVEDMDPRAVDDRLGGWAQARGFPWIAALDTLTATYRRDRRDLYYRLDGHLTPAGNAVAGAYLARRLMEVVPPGQNQTRP